MKSMLRWGLALSCFILISGCKRKHHHDNSDAGFSAGIVFDVGGIHDKSFNQSAHRGLMRAKDELQIRAEYYEPKDPSDKNTGLRDLAGKKCPIIIGVGYAFSQDICKIAKDFPDLKFACVDMFPPADVPPNVLALKFKEEEGSFLVGAIAGLRTKTKKVGFIGGANGDLIHKFEAGFRAGVKHVAPDVEVLVSYVGETTDAFRDPAKGKELALGQYGANADIIYHAAGESGVGVIKAAAEKGQLAIGVDSDQYDLAPGHVLTSMIKRVDTSVFETIRSAKEGKFAGGTRTFGLAEDGVGFVYDDHNRDLIPKEDYEKVMALRADIIAGKIKVPSTR